MDIYVRVWLGFFIFVMEYDGVAGQRNVIIAFKENEDLGFGTISKLSSQMGRTQEKYCQENIRQPLQYKPGDEMNSPHEVTEEHTSQEWNSSVPFKEVLSLSDQPTIEENQLWPIFSGPKDSHDLSSQGIKDQARSFRKSLPLTESVVFERTETTYRIAEATIEFTNLLLTIVNNSLDHCDIVMIYQKESPYLFQLDRLITLTTPKQVVHLRSFHDLTSVLWWSSRCRGYLIFLSDPDPLFTFSDSFLEDWDYGGRYIFVGLSLLQFSRFVSSTKGAKTHDLLAVIESKTIGQWDLYSNQPFGNNKVRHLTTWRKSRFTSERELFPDKLTNLGGAQLKVATFKWEPNVFYSWSKNSSLLHRYGVDIEVTKTLARILNFTAIFIEPPKGQLWGDRLPNGSWGGMMGLIDRAEAMFGVASVYVSLGRASVVDYTAPYDNRMSCFMARNEPPLPKWMALTYPFQQVTWVAILMAIAISGPTLSILASGSQLCHKELQNFRSLGFSYLYGFGVQMRQSQNVLPIMITTQVFLSFFWLYTIILTIVYSTNLTAFLIVSKRPPSMETIRELRKSGIEISALGFFYRNALSSASDNDLQALANTYKGYKSVQPIFKKVEAGKAVFLQNREYIEFISSSKFTSKGVSSVRIMKQCFAPFSIAMAVQRHSLLKIKFDKVMGQLQQSGLIRQFFLRSLRTASASKEYGRKGSSGDSTNAADASATSSDKGHLTSLSIDHLQGLFFLGLVGWILSTMIFVFELYI